LEQQHAHKESGGGVCDTERVDSILRLAFDRLWCDKPGGTSAGAAGASALEANSDDESGHIDDYINTYFRHVAELSRESLYQSHQCALLTRIREDVAAGDCAGSVKDIDVRLDRAIRQERALRSEISNMMRIVEPEESTSCPCLRRSGQSSGSRCCGETSSPFAGKVLPACRSGCQVQ